jgi:MFS family permease
MTTAAPAAAPEARTPPYSWFVLFMLMFIYIFNFLDRQLMSTLQEYIKADLGLSDSQLGLMTGFFFALFYTGFGVIVGFLADRTSRVRILAAGCFLWSLFTALCGMAKTFPTMAVARVGVGIGEAAGAPPSYSIVSDYFPAHKRGLALALFSLGVPFGMALGAGFGGTIADIWSWRHAFVGIGIAGIVASVLLLILVREPKRGQMDEKPAVATGPGTDEIVDQPGFLTTVKDFFSNPILLWTALGCGMAAFVGYAGLNWNVSFLMRVKEMQIADVAAYYALMLAIAMGLGTFLSGFVVDILAKRSKVWYGLLPAIAMALCIPFHLAYVASSGWVNALLLLAGPTFLNIFYLAPALAVVQNTVKPSQRTMAGALLLMVLNLIGLGGGPTMMGFMSDIFGAEHGPVEGLKMAFYALTPFFVLAVFFLLLMARALGKKEKQDAEIAGAAAATA